MNDDDFAVCELPRKRTGKTTRWLGNATLLKVFLTGLGCYLGIIIFFSVFAKVSPKPLVVHQVGSEEMPATWWEILYFNFITILTIGYGDFIPIGLGRILAVTEAILGTGVLGITLAALTAKFMSPPRDAVVFSHYGYYCTDEQRFLVIFLNTTHSPLINAELSSYFKLRGDWVVRPSIRASYITQAVQTFFLDSVSEDDLKANLRDRDGLRFSIAGQIGDTTFSAAIQYPAEEIIVIPNRNELIAYPGFWKVDFSSEEFIRMFHYRPANAPTLDTYIRKLRSPVA